MSTTTTTIDPERQMLGEVEMVGRERWEQIHRRAAAGASIRAIARELDLDRKTVRRCLRQTAWKPYQRAARSDTLLAAHAEYLRRRAAEVDYSAQVLFQELRCRQYRGSYETVKRFVRPLRETQLHAAVTRTRFETPPGLQSQIDWAQARVWLGAQREVRHIFVLTLGYSRRSFYVPCLSETLGDLLDAHEQGVHALRRPHPGASLRPTANGLRAVWDRRRAVELAGIATAVPKSADGAAEMVRQIKVARDTAVKARSSAIITLKTLIVNAPAELREALEPLTDRKLIECCAELESGDLVDPTASVKHSLRSLATRWLTLAAEISAHDKALDSITRTAAPTLREAFGIGPDASAEMMIVAGDNPSRTRSDAAFAKLCGACPIPASSGVTNRHRLFRGGHRQANATLYRIVIVRMRWHQPTIDYVARRTAQGLSKKDIIRCLKRFVAREICNALIDDHRLRAAHLEAA